MAIKFIIPMLEIGMYYLNQQKIVRGKEKSTTKNVNANFKKSERNVPKHGKYRI